MIQFQCDGCRLLLEHPGHDIPPNWASVTVQIRWAGAEVDKSGCSEWETDNALLLCKKCRGADGSKLCEEAEAHLHGGLDRGPKAAPHV